jgi:hypothetical protein
MDKSKLNFIISALMFLCLMAMAGLGFLMKFVLLPGRKAMVEYGRPVELTYLGWDRHDWGDLHSYLAFALLSLLAFHLILHRKKLRGLFERLIPSPRMRTRLAFGFLIVCVLLAYFPFLITPRVEDKGGRGRRQRSEMEAGGIMLAKAPGEFKSHLGSFPGSCSQKFRRQQT